MSLPHPHEPGLTFYTGAAVSPTFMSRWRSKEHIGAARPWYKVQVRRGRMERSFHNNWPSPQFGRIVGRHIRHQWYPDWTPLDDWTTLEGVGTIDLDQSFDNNGITVASIDVDNVAWNDVVGPHGDPYRQRQRGFYWPWRGWAPRGRPGSGDAKNQWFNYLPNAQILVTQGYGADTAVKTFTGLIDSFAPRVRPDKMTLSCRDFGSLLVDEYLFGWNKDQHVNDPITFMPSDHRFLKEAQGDKKTHRWIVINDATDIVRVMLRWAGFKEWEIENSGVNLSVTYTVDKSKTYMDVINAVKEQLGYVFFISEPTSDDHSIGVPVFRRPSVLLRSRSKPIALRSEDMLTDIQPQHDNKDDRAIIRVRGVINKKTGRYLDNPGFGGDASSDVAKRVTFQYWPPWFKNMAGILKQLTYYNVGDQGVLGYKTQQECTVACLLIAVQIALGRDTATVQTPGNPALGLDSFAYVTDEGTGVASRLYVTTRKSTVTIGGDGTSQQHSPYGTSGSSQNELIWASELGGSLCDNPEFEKVVDDYTRAIHGQKVLSWAPKGWD